MRTSFTAIVDYIKEKLDPNWKPPSATVITLTSANFTKAVQDTQLMLVQFFAPWCQHCKQVINNQLSNLPLQEQQFDQLIFFK